MNMEDRVNLACKNTVEGVAIALGTALGQEPEHVRHIAMVHAVQWMLNQAAMSAFKAFAGEQIRPNDPRALALMNDWLDAFKLAPDYFAISKALTDARDKAFPNG